MYPQDFEVCKPSVTERRIFKVSIITQVFIEIRALPLAENGVIFHYNHLRGSEVNIAWEDKFS